MNNEGLKNLLIVSITPYFLDKEVFWFEKNLKKIMQASKTQSFFEDNIIFLEKGETYNFSQFLRKLDEMGYERVFKVQEPGEFSQRGGTVDVFPINLMHAVRFDFFGNKVESITVLSANEEKVYPPEFLEKKFRQTREILKKRLKSHKLFSDLNGLKSGDYLVHLDHGVGKFLEVTEFEFSDSGKQKYYVLEYAKEDKLYVPLGLEKKLSRYVGFTDPKVSRLGSLAWQKIKGKIKEEVEKFAKELLSLYAQKESAQRPSYSADNELEFQLRAGFAYEETPDQLQAVEDIEKDLAKTKPMDRIVCGDVGFGKTEIAIRAALLASANSRQTALICPTTILANQHFNSFKKRFEKLPVKIAMLSRLQTETEQKKIIKEIKEGKIDIVIGTHRILSKDIEFKNLELRRKGQIYYLHNRVQTIEMAKKEIEELCPKAKIGIIHGRMPEKQLVKIMDDFQKEKTNVLVATTIIENGLDLPKVNTIIIEDATRLGLSQAHQIRGRVGRSHRESFAYFMFKPKSLTSLAKERLKALEDAKELGAGYEIAIKDLELRGAGNILGKEQSGAINKIGLNLYSQILSEAIEKMKS